MTPTADCATRNNASPATGSLTYTQLPENPVEIARQQKWGHDDGRPATYDSAIDTAYNHSMGIRKGHIRYPQPQPTQSIV